MEQEKEVNGKNKGKKRKSSEGTVPLDGHRKSMPPTPLAEHIKTFSNPKAEDSGQKLLRNLAAHSLTGTLGGTISRTCESTMRNAPTRFEAR